MNSDPHADPNTLRAVIRQSWQTMVRAPLMPLTAPPSGVDIDLASRLTFSNGTTLSVEANAAAIRHVAASMTGQQPAEVHSDDLFDALKELTNVLAGSLRCLIAPGESHSLPEMTNPEDRTGQPSGSLWFECDGALLCVHLQGVDAAAKSETIRALLVEDSAVARKMISSALASVTEPRFELAMAESLAEALELAKRHPFDVVLLDLTLRDSYGLETCIRAHQALPRVPIVILTGLDDTSFALEALKAGAQDYLVKTEVAPGILTRSIRYAMERMRASMERDKLTRELMALSHRAGMAEIATGVLHNVGNALNSVNISSQLVGERIRNSASRYVRKVADLLQEHEGDLVEFLTNHEKGKHLPAYLVELATSLDAERRELLDELGSLADSVEHVREIVATQQRHARATGVLENVSASELIEDAIRIGLASLERHGVRVIRELTCNPSLLADRNKVVQILTNLLKNAKDSVCATSTKERQITVATRSLDQGVAIDIRDNGVGIPPELLSKIFQHGFSTKVDGHGFGLHTCVLAARELGGDLTAHSDGAGKGATFTLTLPLQCKSQNGENEILMGYDEPISDLHQPADTPPEASAAH